MAANLYENSSQFKLVKQNETIQWQMHDFNKYFAQIMANDNNNISKHSNKTLEKRKIKNTNTADKQKLSFDYYMLKRLISRPFWSHQNTENAIRVCGLGFRVQDLGFRVQIWGLWSLDLVCN